MKCFCENVWAEFGYTSVEVNENEKMCDHYR